VQFAPGVQLGEQLLLDVVRCASCPRRTGERGLLYGLDGVVVDEVGRQQQVLLLG